MEDKKTVYMAVAGLLPENTDALTKLIEDMDRCVSEALGGLIRMEWLVSPSFSDVKWLTLARNRGIDCHVACKDTDSAWTGAGKTRTVISTKLWDFEEQWMTANADVMLVVWDEQSGDMDGAVFDLINRAHSERMPCVWLSASTGHAYWPMENYYEPFDPQGLTDLLRRMYAPEPLPSGDAENEDRYKQLFKLGVLLQNRFFRKHTPKEERDRPADGAPHEEDKKPESKAGRQMWELFRRYDREAIRCGDKYNALMYYRAVLPAVSAVCLAVGFYGADLAGFVRTIAGWFPASLFPAMGRVAAWVPPVWLDTSLHWLSGIGFLCNALLLYFTYKVSEASIVKYWHTRYVNSRLIAEIYRVFLHFQPYGICVDIKRICGRNPHILAAVREQLRRIGLSSCVIDQRNTNKLLDGVEAMLRDQASYHERSIHRYEAITNSLLKRAAALKGVSLFVLVTRGIMQFFIGIGVLGRNDKTGSMANMIAMLMPAYATYHASKNDQCKYSFHLENHRRMKKSIDDALQRLREIRQSVECPSVEMLVSISETLTDLMILDDTANWYDAVSKTSFSRL